MNRSNLGIQRIFHALLVEGKEPPVIEDSGETIRVTIRSSDLSVPFRSFIAREEEEGKEFSVDHLLILQYLRRHPEVDTATAARICQRPESSAREILASMERRFGYLERGGAARGTYWFLRREYYDDLVAGGDADRDRRVDWEAAKTRVLSILRRRAEEGEAGLSNADVRRIAGLTRNQAFRLMRELRKENAGISSPGRGRNARYVYEGNGAENADTH